MSAEEYADLSADATDARRAMRKYILEQKDQELSGLYYRSLTLSEHEAARASMKTRDKYGLALMMIREGCADPREIAAAALRAAGIASQEAGK